VRQTENVLPVFVIYNLGYRVNILSQVFFEELTGEEDLKVTV
jgi:hypothetical protein